MEQSAHILYYISNVDIKCTYLNIPDYHRISIGIEEILALWIRAQNNRLSASSSW